MIRTVRCKRILGLSILVLIVSVFSFLQVQAKTKEEWKAYCKDYLPNTKFVSRYNATIEEVDITDSGLASKYKISINPKSSDADLKKALRKIVFVVSEVNGKKQDGKQTVSYKKPLIIKGSFTKDSSGEQKMEVKLTSVEENADPHCIGKVNFTLTVEKMGDSFTTKEPVNPIVDEFGQTDGQAIDCSKPQTEAFEKAFCEAKNGAMAADPNKKLGLNYDGKFNDHKTFKDVLSGYKELKCSVTNFNTVNGYYVNKTYLYGSGENNMTFGTYKYHYSPGAITKGATVKCKVKCEESVVVEYGPPIASKAGLCFEYKVKVTSRVSCSMSEKPVVPEVQDSYCTPTPICRTSAGTYTNQGGPNEEFDACVKACDGGKYTDKCSKKCYSKVYGNDSASKTTTAGREYLTERLAYSESAFSLGTCIKESSYHGCYYRSGGGINWKGQAVSTPGRWYLVYPHKDLSEYAVFGNGIYRHVYSDGNHCHDVCWWAGCSGNVYLNPGQAEKDRENNKEIYDKAVAKCKATATCTTTTADFTISVNYKDGSNTVKTINFPYTENNNSKDHLTSKGAANGYQDTATNHNTTILDYSGCYKEKKAYRIYMTEWSFPGSWINNKTGEISYVNKNNNTAWQTLKEKFCIPLDAQNVNQKWWNYYYSRDIINPNYSTNSSSYQQNCIDQGYGAKLIKTITEDDIEDWNIKAHTKNFGYFGWNIKISCFYALNTNPSSVTNTNSSTSVPDACQSGSAYRIRSVDLNNLFPATDGSNNSRTPGFNWSEYATVTKKAENAANNYYTIKPAEYATKVQKVGDSVYSDEYLDYSIDLTRSMIAALKKENKAIENNYSDFSGKTDTNYVINYRSPLFRDGGILSSSSKYPNEESLKCNNMKKFNGGCEG